MNYPEPALDDLYRELILDHYRHPRNKGSLDSPMITVEGYNPLCGDEVEVQLMLTPQGVIEDVAFKGRGCSISQASSSMMTDAVKGRSKREALALLDSFKRMMTDPEEEPAEELGDLEAFQGVAKFPVRVKCATLAWHVLEEGLEKDSNGSNGHQAHDSTPEEGKI
jgi:nitrogen fixation protein NifU and related proteins